MAFSNLTRILLYVIAGISLLVILFFYASPNTVNMDELDMRVEELMSPAVLDMPAALPAAESVGTDSTASDSMAVEEVGAVQGTEDRAAVLSSADAPAVEEISLLEHMSFWEYLVYNRTDIVLIWAYILLILTGISAVVFPLLHVANNPKALIRLVVVLVGAAAIIGISYLLASDTPINIIGYSGESNRDPATLKMVDTTLFVTYMLFGLALLSILYSIVSRVFK